MILAIKIMKHDLAYASDIKECLVHNSSNPEIEKIVVFTDFDLGIDIDSKSKKIQLMKLDLGHLKCIERACRISRDFVVYSTPFVKFDSNLGNIRKNLGAGKILRSPDSYYIFRKDAKLLDRSSIDEILGGVFESPRFYFQKIGYFGIPNFPVPSLGWKISKASLDQKEESVADVVPVPERRGFPAPVQPSQRTNMRNIDVVIVSVDYNDLLEITLDRNRRIFDRITVVTSTSDKRCVEICEKMGAKAVVTDCMYSDGAEFNKGKAINEGLASLKDPEFVLILDADIIVPDMDIDFPLEENTIYYRDRIMLRDYGSYERFEQGYSDFETESLGPVGYFQLFKYRRKLKYAESSSNAAWSDIRFIRNFRWQKKIESPVLHLGEDRKNWSGRTTSRFEPVEDSFIEKSKYTICSYYFNFRNDIRQKNNFISFLEQFNGRYGDMIVGLVDYGDLDFEVPCRKLVVEGDLGRRIWSKELLINKVLDSIETEYIIWIDGDIIYESLDWLDNIEEVVRENDFVQLFENISYMDDSGNVLEKRKSLASYRNEISGKNIDRLLGKKYNPGVAWLAKTSILKEKKLFEKMYVGGGDTIMAYGLYSSLGGWTLDRVRENSESIYSDAMDWISRFGSYRVGFLKENVSHLYHGDLKDRDYDGRYKNLKNMEYSNVSNDRTFAGIAAIPTRENSLRICIESIIDQVDNIGVYLNGWDNVPDFLNHDRISVVRSQDEGDNGDAGKFYWIDGFQGYYFSCDDDIVYPENYISRTIESIERYDRKAVIGFHGSVILEGFRDYYDKNSRKVYMFSKKVGEDTQTHILGTGTIGFHTSTIDVRFSDFEFPNMADVFLARLGQEQCVPFFVQAHRAGEMRSIESKFAISLSGMRKDSSKADTSERQNLIVNSIEWKMPSLDSKKDRLKILMIGRFDTYKKGGINKSNNAMLNSLRRIGHEVYGLDSMSKDYSIPDDIDVCIVYPGDNTRPDFKEAESKMLEVRNMGVPCCINLSYNNEEERSREIDFIFSKYNGPEHAAKIYLLSFSESIRQDEIMKKHGDFVIVFPKTILFGEPNRIKRFEERSGILLGDIAKLESSKIVGSDSQIWIDELKKVLPNEKIYAYKQYGTKTRLKDIELVDYMKEEEFTEWLSSIKVNLTITQKLSFEMLPIECQSLGIPVVYIDMPQSLNHWIGHTGICVDGAEEAAKMVEYLYRNRISWNSYSKQGLLNYERCRLENVEQALDSSIRKILLKNG